MPCVQTLLCFSVICWVDWSHDQTTNALWAMAIPVDDVMPKEAPPQKPFPPDLALEPRPVASSQLESGKDCISKERG